MLRAEPRLLGRPPHEAPRSADAFSMAEDLAFKELIDAANDAFVTFDRTGLVRTWNTAAARIFGYMAEDVLGHLTTILVTDAEVEVQQARMGRVLNGERIRSVSAEGRRRDGTVVPLKMTLIPAAEGGRGCLIARDLTEEQLAQATLTEAELRLREAQELSHVGLWLWDSASDSLQISDELYRILGVSPFEFDGTMSGYLACTHPEDREALASALTISVGSGVSLEQEYRILRPDGSTGWIYSRAERVTGLDNTSAGLRGVAQDVTERRRAAESLRDQASLLDLLRRMAVAANEATDLEDALRTCLRDICLHTGWPVGQALFIEGDRVALSRIVYTEDVDRYGRVVGATDHPELLGDGPVARAWRDARPLVAAAGGMEADEMGQAAADSGLDTTVVLPLLVGAQVAAMLRFFASGRPEERLLDTLWDGTNQLGRVVERARSRDELSHQALHDTLTGLPNRTLLMNRLGHALARQARTASQVALIFVDLDNFKLINDSLGHEIGDDLVVKVSRRLVRVLGPEDSIARFGGDQFIVLCEYLGREQEAVQLAERILASISQPISLRGHKNAIITASAGIAIAAEPGITPEALLRDADLAMYRAKEAGRGRYQIFDSAMHQRATQRLTIANELRTAIGDGQLRLLYQPQVNVATGELVGVESLVRWQHPERGLLTPIEFIAIAEETHLIVALGDWVLMEACRQAAEWCQQYPDRTPLKLSVNVSPKQLARPELIDEVASVLARTGLVASSLCIEITESVLMNGDLYLEALLALKLLGVSIGIDDFGTGYSSLAYLRRYPVDVIKVDKGFVDGLADPDPRPTAIMAAVVDLAHALGVIALAEGVETRSQQVALEELGCDECQGYYFSRPVRADVISALLGTGGRLDADSGDRLR
jgi:diguanylate cyclase (GGDEF)-like protein/PAS domain S-box-containing protein